MPSGLGAAWPVAFPAIALERKELYTQLVGWRKAAKKLEVDYELQLGRRFSGDPSHAFVEQQENAVPGTRNMTDVQPCTPACDHVLDLQRRPNPFQDITNNVDVVTIKGYLQTGPDLNSQVYTGMLKDVEVVIKVYQSSWILKPSDFAFLKKDEVCEDKEKESHFSGFVAEQWAYERMRPIHGIAVPHLYGFFEVELPHGEPCIAMILEYIKPALNVKDAWKKVCGGEEAALKAVGTRLFLALHAVHSCDICPQDTSHHNVIIPDERPTGLVFIDFADCVALKSKKIENGIRQIYTLLVQFGFDKSLVLTWLQSELEGNEAWRAMFDIPPDNWEMKRPRIRLGPVARRPDLSSSQSSTAAVRPRSPSLAAMASVPKRARVAIESTPPQLSPALVVGPWRNMGNSPMEAYTIVLDMLNALSDGSELNMPAAVAQSTTDQRYAYAYFDTEAEREAVLQSWTARPPDDSFPGVTIEACDVPVPSPGSTCTKAQANANTRVVGS